MLLVAVVQAQKQLVAVRFAEPVQGLVFAEQEQEQVQVLGRMSAVQAQMQELVLELVIAVLLAEQVQGLVFAAQEQAQVQVQGLVFAEQVQVQVQEQAQKQMAAVLLMAAW